MSEKLIQNKYFVIRGKPGFWKTLFAVLIASMYKRIYSNVDIYRYWKLISNRITSLKEFDDIPKDEHSVFVFDESGINNNAREGFSEENKDGVELAALGRKYDMDIILITQLDRMLDVVWRELADFEIEMHRPMIHKNGRVEFEYDAWTGWYFQGTRGAYLLEALKAIWLEYNSLDKSRLWKKRDLKIKVRPENVTA